ncbi:MAG: GxxExxY protein [Bacteroidales bacterium]|nr:GxxExxY protein [Bacteroidales bacterium]
MKNLIYPHESFQIIGAAFEVHNVLGSGFLESVYQEALGLELSTRNIPFEREKELNIMYKDKLLKKRFYADFVCFNNIIVELKAVAEILPEHRAQVLNYLKATQKPLGLLINFGESSLKFERYANTRPNSLNRELR